MPDTSRYTSVSHCWLFVVGCSQVFLACQPPTDDRPHLNKHNWTTEIPGAISLSSPRLTDLTGDGILDVVLGAGGSEWTHSDTAVVALDGADGAVLWRRPGRNQLYGSALFQDINGDSLPDVIIGGRSAELQAINGRTGELIWEFLKTDAVMGHKKAGWFNFSTAVPIPDQDNDHQPDLLMANGGDATIADNQRPRPVGRLLILSSATGKVLHEARMPDGRETYMTPVLIRQKNQPAATWILLFGTGGEAIGGHLYRATLGDLLRNDLSHAIPLAEEKYKGFCAPPVVCQLTPDGIADFVVSTVAGRTLAIDGQTNQPLWTFSHPGSETFGCPAPGYFVGNDRIPDFFVAYALGVYPYYSDGASFLLDGRTGKPVRQFTTGGFSYASPLTADANRDGHDDAIQVVNGDEEKGGRWRAFAKLVVYDFHNNRQYNLTDSLAGANFAITPWLGDMDHNGRTDVVFGTSAAVTKIFPGKNRYDHFPLMLRVARRERPTLAPETVRWGQYMGNRGSGVFD